MAAPSLKSLKSLTNLTSPSWPTQGRGQETRSNNLPACRFPGFQRHGSIRVATSVTRSITAKYDFPRCSNLLKTANRNGRTKAKRRRIEQLKMIAVESSRIKFHLAGGLQPLILLPVTVNGQGPFQFILDTGAGTSLLSPELAQKVGANIIGAKEGQSAGGKVPVSLAKVHSLAVGETRRDDVDVGIVDLSQIAKTIGTKIVVAL